MTDPHELVNAVKSQLVATGKFRPEIAGRIDKVYVFKKLQGIVIAEIVALKMVGLAKEYGLELTYVDPNLIFRVMKASKKMEKFGIREVERDIGNMLGDHFIAAKDEGCKRVRLDIEEDGVLAIGPAD
jgi:ATP-dependent Clp protease ATP-binding subunit ClpA